MILKCNCGWSLISILITMQSHDIGIEYDSIDGTSGHSQSQCKQSNHQNNASYSVDWDGEKVEITAAAVTLI